MLLHGTKERFDKFRVPGGEDELTGASNGFLGTWFCRESLAFIAEGYGRTGWIAEVAEPDPETVFELPLTRLVAWHEQVSDVEDPREFYSGIRSELLARGKKWLAVLEKDGSSPTLVCLAPEELEISQWRCLAEPEMEPGF